MENRDIWFGEGKIAFIPDDWKKTPSSEVICHYFTADISKIKKDKVILDGDSTQNE